jgi:hypothetical protein
MCSLCVEACRRYFPLVTDDRMGDFLMSVTAFPFVCGKDVARQLLQARNVATELRSRPGFDQGISDEDIAYQLAEAERVQAVLAMIAIIKPEDALTRELEDRMNINRELEKRHERIAEIREAIRNGTYIEPHPELYVDAVMADVEDES